MNEFGEILGLAWQASAGDPPEPTGADEFRTRLFERIESVLVNSYIEDLTEWRERLRDLGHGLAIQFVARFDDLTETERRELSELNKFTMMQAERLGVVMFLDSFEDGVRHRGDQPMQ